MKATTFSNRKNTLIAMFVFMGVVFLARLFYLQIIDDSSVLYANRNALRYIIQHPARGIIYDRNGKLMTYNEATYDLMVVPNQVDQLDTADLCRILGLTPEDVRKRLEKATLYSRFSSSIFEKQISNDVYGYLEEKMYKFQGFYVQSRTLRKYPVPAAAHTLGYIGEVNDAVIAKNPYYKPGDYIGVSGIEKSYEELLRGRKGVRVTMVDVHNREKGSFQNGMYDTIAQAGSNLWSSIDLDLQAYGEKLMKGKKGSIVAIEPSTGELLTIVSSPGYDPNLLVGRVRAENYMKLLRDTLNNPLFNRALMAMYPPGSTFKIVNALIGEQEGVLKPTTQYSCEMGFHAGNLTVKCHRHPSPLNLSQSIQNSCNAYYCKAFKAIIDNRRKYRNSKEGYNAWRQYVLKMGFGRKFNSDLPYELKGILPTAEFYDKTRGKNAWKALSIISLSIGQGELGTTPLQLANLAAIIANRGYYYTPHIVKAIGNEKNKNTRFSTPIETGIESQYFDPIIQGMKDAVLKGTATSAKQEQFTIAGKTGTAQNPHGQPHSLFICFAPVVNPKIAMCVIVENGGYGGEIAAPIASLMIEYYISRKVTKPELEQKITNINLIRRW
jgi:penicillin-binding protein 2